MQELAFEPRDAMPYRGYEAARPLAKVPGPPSRSEIMRVVPPDCKRILSRHADILYVTGLSLMPQFTLLRADGRENLLRFARLLAARASAERGTTFQNREKRAAEAGLSVSTWKAHHRRLEAWRCMATVREGRIYWHGDQVRHDAAEYVLFLPKGILRKIADAVRRARRDRISRPPTVSAEGSSSEPPREACGKRGAPSGRARSRGRPRRAGPGLAAAAAGAVAGLFRQWGGSDLTDGWIGYLARDFLAAGWSAADLAKALECPPPPATRHRYLTSSARSPRRVIAWRLGRWRDPGGRPLLSPSQAAAVARNRIRQAATPYRAETIAANRAANAGFDPGRILGWLREQAARGWPGDKPPWEKPQDNPGPAGSTPREPP